MNDFEKVYKDMVEQIPSLKIDAASVLSEARHRKMVAAGRRRAAMLAVFFCLLTMGAGTATAVNYKQSVIRVSEYGFTSADAKTMAESAGMNSKTDPFAAEPFMTESAEGAEEAMLRIPAPEDYAEIEKLDSAEVEEIPQYEYDSVEVFQKESDVVAAFPNFALFRAEVEEQYIVVNGDFLLAMFGAGEKRMTMSQMDFRNCEGFASSTQYSEKVYNERTLTTKMGFQYTLVDSKNLQDNTVSIHAAISVGGRELILDFDGFNEGEVAEILEALDLTVYFQ